MLSRPEILEMQSQRGTLAGTGLLCVSALLPAKTIKCSAFPEKQLNKEDFGIGVGGGEVTKAKPIPFTYKAGGGALLLVVAKGRTAKH